MDSVTVLWVSGGEFNTYGLESTPHLSVLVTSLHPPALLIFAVVLQTEHLLVAGMCLDSILKFASSLSLLLNPCWNPKAHFLFFFSCRVQAAVILKREALYHRHSSQQFVKMCRLFVTFNVY